MEFVAEENFIISKMENVPENFEDLKFTEPWEVVKVKKLIKRIYSYNAEKTIEWKVFVEVHTRKGRKVFKMNISNQQAEKIDQEWKPGFAFLTRKNFYKKFILLPVKSDDPEYIKTVSLALKKKQYHQLYLLLSR